jgi:hypothetical protein
VTPLHLNLTELKEHQRLSALIDGPVKALKLKPRAKPPIKNLQPPVEDPQPSRFRRADDT